MADVDPALAARIEIIETLRAESAQSVATLADNAWRLAPTADEDMQRDLAAEVRAAGLAAEAPAERAAAVAYLARQAEHGDGYIRRLALRLLTEFARADFDESAKAALGRIAAVDPSAGAFRAVGVAGVVTAVPLLRDAARGPAGTDAVSLQASLPWNAALALSRMGDGEMADRVARRALAEADPANRATLLFPDLAYTRAPACLDALAAQLDSPDRLPTVKPTQTEGDPVAELAARALLGATMGGPDPWAKQGDVLVTATKGWVAGLKAWPIRP